MEITTEEIGSSYILRLQGRLDASWAGHVENALTAAVRGGNHHVAMNLAAVHYVSSAGLRVLLVGSKQLRAIKGTFAIIQPSEAVREVLDLAGLTSLISEEAPAAEAAPRTTREETSEQATYEIFPETNPGRTEVKLVGTAGDLEKTSTSGDEFRLAAGMFSVGVGALGENFADCAPRLGEFLAVAGVAAYQPTDGSSQPDFLVSEGGLVPEGALLTGLSGSVAFSLFARFEKTDLAPSVGLAELAQQAIKWAGGQAVVVTVIAETMGLVGATLRKSPATSTDRRRFEFPEIRDWLSFTNERGYRDTTTLVVGVAAPEGHALAPQLRSIGDGVLGHFHAANFPYRPLQKGMLDLDSSVRALFDGNNLQAVLHLLADRREFSGIGESEFYRGAIWAAPITG